jgi:hypothetical protein
MKNYFILIIFLISRIASANPFVTTSNIFSGETASNLTAGAPLSVSSTGKVATGITNVETAFSSTITTTSATDVVMTGMTTTPAAGTYLVVFSSWFTHSNGNATVTFSIYAGASQSAGSIRTTTPFEGSIGSANNGKEAGTNAIVTVNGSQAIALEWHTSAATATAHDGTMDVVRLQ